VVADPRPCGLRVLVDDHPLARVDPRLSRILAERGERVKVLPLVRVLRAEEAVSDAGGPFDRRSVHRADEQLRPVLGHGECRHVRVLEALAWELE
jgi:hypothetical protein